MKSVTGGNAPVPVGSAGVSLAAPAAALAPPLPAAGVAAPCSPAAPIAVLGEPEPPVELALDPARFAVCGVLLAGVVLGAAAVAPATLLAAAGAPADAELDPCVLVGALSPGVPAWEPQPIASATHTHTLFLIIICSGLSRSKPYGFRARASGPCRQRTDHGSLAGAIVRPVGAKARARVSNSWDTRCQSVTSRPVELRPLTYECLSPPSCMVRSVVACD